jgi:4-hydroxybenzoate polyprenyltransferase
MMRITMNFAHWMKAQGYGSARALWRPLSCIRFGEVILMQGTPWMGIVLSVSKLEPAMIPTLAVFLPAGFLLVAHIWILNDWSDYREDRVAVNNVAQARASKVARATLLRLSLGSLLCSLALFGLLPLQTLIIAGIITVLGFVYSFPGLRSKGVIGLSSLTHFAGGIFHFLLGYSLFGEMNARALLISLFFALVFTAGHATQEVQDYENDRASGVRTNPVCLGKKPIFLAAFVMFVMAFVYLAYLAVAGIVPVQLGFSALLLPFQAVWTFQVLRGGLTHERLAWLRQRYRAAFALVGLNILSLLRT